MTSRNNGSTFKVGDLLNNTFRIEAILGSGGTSEVFRARNEISGRLVALKVLKAEFAGNEDFLVLMRREEEMRDIRHSAVVGYSENHRTQDGHIYLVMDFVDGPSLEARMKAGGMSADELLVVCKRVAEGLHAAHERRIIHRDLSPDNIILKGGDPARAVIIDFGIAKDATPGAATIVGSDFAGKFSYAAPEQLGGKTDARSDIYALGVTLLATFRGGPPDSGSNLLEVLEKKSKPLDLSDVPPPLYDILFRMVAPDPEARFQSCQQILSAIEQLGQASDPVASLLEPAPAEPATPKATTPPDPAAERTVVSKPPKPAAATPDGKSGRNAPILAVLAILLVAGAGGAAWFLGLLGGGLPVADPFVLSVERAEGGVPILTGNVPSEAMLDRVAAFAAATGGSQDVRLARGDLAEDWESAVEEALSTANALESYRVNVVGNQIEIDGQTDDAAVRDQVELLFSEGAQPVGMSIVGAVDYISPPLPAAAIQPVLESLADCGPLELAAAPAGGFGIADTIGVTGRLSSPERRLELFDKLDGIADGRDVNLETEILNPALCVAEQRLPKVPAGGFGIEFSFGSDGQPNPAGSYFVGENPVIDVVIPADVTTGFLYVSIIDVAGSVFHLLPNVNRSDNSVSSLRDGREGPVRVRVAYPVSEMAPERIAFLIDDSLLGKSMVLVLHSKTPLFGTHRPTAESVEGYAEALDAEQANGANTVRSLDSRILTMARP